MSKLCNQCGKPAIYEINGHPLCLDCYYKLQQIQQAATADLMRMLNFSIANMESVTGTYGLFPRVQIPDPVVHQGPINLNNFQIDRSVIGAINTGNIDQIEVAMSNISNAGNDEFANLLKEFTEAVMQNKEIGDEIKNEILEYTSFIAQQATAQKELQKPSLIRAAMERIFKLITVSSSLIGLWDKVHPFIQQLLG